jgi:glycosyltransferase involved in cell wall biosynthesis
MSLINFRGDLISALIENNYEVLCAAPALRQTYIDKIEALGAKTVEFDLQRTGLDPFKDLDSIAQLKKIIVEHKVDLVFPYTIKPVVYGSIAARKYNVPVVSLITGLGFTFSGVTLKARLLQQITQKMYRYALRKNKVVIFQNQDDRQLFLDKKIVSRQQRTEVVDGSGINLQRFDFRVSKKQAGDTLRFIIVGRLIKEKGVGLYIDAAKKLKSQFKNVEFHLIGRPPDDNPSSLSETALSEYGTQGLVVYHGHQTNVISLLSKADIFVLPSYYREGVPRSILEALSLGMPIITTLMPGCRETVDDGKNGFLIPPEELEPLIEAMTFFLENPHQVAEMGRESRILAERKFDVNIINDQLLKLIGDSL